MKPNSAKNIVRLAEKMIPANLRQYYIGAGIMKCDVFEAWSEWNCDIMLNFKYPVCGVITDSRYAHANLLEMEEALSELYIDEDSHTEDYAEYDEWADAVTEPFYQF
jgi:hypothetical protein